MLNHELSGGGQARVVANLAGALARPGHQVDFLFWTSPGPNPDQVPSAVNIVDLRTERSPWRLARFLMLHPSGLRALLWSCLLMARPIAQPRSSALGILRGTLALLALVRYLRRGRPAVVCSAGDWSNLLALLARRIAGAGTRVVISHHSLATARLRMHAAQVGGWRTRRAAGLMGRAFLEADAIVAVSEAAGDDLARTLRIPRERIVVIHNPVVGSELAAAPSSPPEHPWFRPGAPPVILGVGRLVDDKDFPTLIRAFARVRRQRPARLAILGEGDRRGELEAMAAALGVTQDVAMPGFVPNPFAWMSRAGVFVLSSKSESLSAALIEALACGCPVVSTDCIGPSEILRGENLLPVGDDAALAAAIVTTLDDPPPREPLRQRAMVFTVERAAEAYARIMFRKSA